jgi:hypothetical protein
MAETIKIGGEFESTATGNVVAAASAIKDKTKNKYQSEINNDVARHENEIHGTGGIDSRVTDLEAMEQIVIDGGDAQIATGSDFTNPDATKRAKIPTVGAIVDGLNDGVYDVSKRNPTAGPNSDGKFTLDYILSNADTLIPTGWRHGGMNISFVHTYDNKYVQARCIADEFTTDTTQWVVDDGGVLVENPEYVYVEKDSKGCIAWAIKKDGTVFYGAGCPPQVKEYVLAHKAEIIAELATKVDKEEGKELSSNDFTDEEKAVVDTNTLVENSEYLEVIKDSNGRISECQKKDSTKEFFVPIKTPKVETKELIVNNENFDDVVDGLNERLDNIKPSNLHSLVEDKTAVKNISLKVDETVNGNDLIFTHITDTHSGKSGEGLDYTADIMNMCCYVASFTGSQFLGHTGDAIHGIRETAEDAKKSYQALFSQTKQYPLPILFAEGNFVHDFGKPVGDDRELNREQVQTLGNRYKKWFADAVVYNENDTVHSYYYFDMKKEKCRVFMLDSQDYGSGRVSYGFSSQQISFVEAALSDALTNNLNVVFFAHMPLYEELFNGNDDGVDMTTRCAAMRTAIGTFTAGGGTVLAYIYGHMHLDDYWYDFANKIPFVCLTCACKGVASTLPEWGYIETPSKNTDDDTRYAFDTYIINPDSKRVHIYRFGAGHDRIFDQTITEVSVGNSIILTTELTGSVTLHIGDDTKLSVSGMTITGLATGNTYVAATDANGNVEFYNISVIN